MVKYVFENNYTITFYDDKNEALKAYSMMLDSLTESEKNKLYYFRLYAIKAENEDIINDCADLLDLCTEMIEKFK